MKTLALLLLLALSSCGMTYHAQFEKIRKQHPGTIYSIDKNQWLVISDSTATYLKWRSTLYDKIVIPLKH